MIRKCSESDFETVYDIINDAAKAYENIIPEDCWKVPYMSREELREEIERGVVFFAYKEGGRLIGVTGMEDVRDVTLLRHAYIRTSRQKEGIGGKLLSELRKKTARPILIGTWADAIWAIRFYERHGFQLVSPDEKDRLLEEYWTISPRQVETSVVLADQTWFALFRKGCPEEG
jgi:N-acetylglutamate synthase-like GNAT family acetyltransferase